MNKTQNFGLTLPEKDDFYDIEVFNQNNRIIDTLLHELANSGPKELIRTFTASGTFIPANHDLSAGDVIDVYIAGGGGGGLVGGGGGGQCILLRNVVLSAASYHIVVGAGGTGGGGRQNVAIVGTAGGASSAFGRSAPGGSPAPNLNNNGGPGGSGGGSGGYQLPGLTPTMGGDGGSAGSGGSGLGGGVGAGNTNLTPLNPYDGIAYGSGGGGAFGGRGGGAGGSHSTNASGGNGHLGGGGGGCSSINFAHLGGNGGISGGGGGSARLPAMGVDLVRTAGNGGNGIVYIYARPRRTLGHRAATTLLSAHSAEPQKPIAILKDGACVDVAVFHTEEEAQSFLAEGSWPEADGIQELDQDFGIGDKWDGKEWIKEEPLEEEQA